MNTEIDRFVHEAPEPECPPLGSTIWRYMKLSRFEDLISTGTLHFSNVSKFADNHEHRLQQNFAEHLGDEYGSEWVKDYQCKVQAILDKAAVSCWHKSAHESTAMWDVIVRDGCGVAIKSTVGRLQAQLGSINGAYIRRVQYLDYDTQIPNLSNEFGTLLFKRPMYEWEKEVRAILLNATEEVDHVKVPVKPGELITEIVVSDKCEGLWESVKDLCEQQKVRVPVNMSMRYQELVGSVWVIPRRTKIIRHNP